MKLSDHEKNILSIIALNAEYGIPEIQRITGYKSHTIRYAIDRMAAAGIIRLFPLINLYSLGYETHSVYFSLTSRGELLRGKLFKTLVDSDRVSWLAHVSGPQAYCVDVVGRNLQDVQDFLNSISERYGAIFADKCIASQLSFTVFRPDFLGGLAAGPLYIQSGPTADNTYMLSDTDHAILAGFADKSNLSFRELARRLGLPNTTVSRRIRELKAKGVIAGILYLIDIQAIGMAILKLRVALKGSDAEFRKKFFTYCEKHPGVSILIECCGAWDYELGIVLENASLGAVVSNDLMRCFDPYVSSLEYITKFSQLKINSFPFIKQSAPAKKTSPGLKLAQGF